MDFLDVIAGLNAGALPEHVPPVPSEVENPLTANDLPFAMPLTNRLDKMTVEQARWAIANGTAWIAYLKENKGEVYQPSAKPVEVSDAEKYQAIGDVLENVWLDLTDNMARSYLATEQIQAWVDTLEWAITFCPNETDECKAFINVTKDELEAYQLIIDEPKGSPE